ncbi:MAG: ribosomal protein L13e [Candidatus Thorarchaeota archaeon]
MSFDVTAEPFVKSPNDAKPRRGRGFTSGELKESGLTIKEARDMGLLVDVRRKTLHPENVEILKTYIKEMEELVEALIAEEETKPSISDAITELSSLKIIKKADAEALAAAGISSLEDLAYCEIDKVAKKSGIDEDRLMAMVKAALNKV